MRRRVIVFLVPIVVLLVFPGNILARASSSRRDLTGVKTDKIWTARTNGPVVSSPAVKKGMVVFATKNRKHGKVKSVDSQTGQTIWEYDTGDEVWSSPVIVGDSVYIGGRNGWFYCFELYTGRMVWKKKLQSMFGSPVVKNNKIIVCSGGNLVALDRKGGKTLWKFNFPGGTNSTPAVWDGKVYFGGGMEDRTVYAIDLASGKEIWHREVKDSIDVPLTVVQNTVLFGDWGNTFYALDAQTGQLKWEVVRGGDMEPAVVSGAAAVHNNRVFWGHGNGDFIAADINSGRKLWSYEEKSEWRSSPLVAENMLIVTEASNPTKLLFIRPENGEVIREISFPGKNIYMFGTPAIEDNKIYIGFSKGDGKKGYLCALQFKKYNLAVKRHKRDSRATKSIPDNSNGKLFSGLLDYQAVQPFKSSVADSIRLPYGIVGAPLYLRETMFYGDWAGWVYAYNYFGKLKWKNPLPRAIVAPPIQLENKIIVADRLGKIVAFDQRTGKEKWRLDIGAQLRTGPVATKNGFVVGDEKGRIVLINSDGSKGWVRTISSAVARLSKENGNLLVGGDDGEVLALNARTGGRHWKFQAEYGIATPFEIRARKVYFGDWLGTIYCLKLEKPQIKWKFKANRAPQGKPLLVRGLLHVYSRDGTLTALHPDFGRKIWEYNFSGGLEREPLFYEGGFYVKNRAGELVTLSYGPLDSVGQSSFSNLQKTGYTSGNIPAEISKIRWRWQQDFNDESPVSPVTNGNLIYQIFGRNLFVLRDFPTIYESSHFSANLQRTGVFPGRTVGSLPETEWIFQAPSEITSSPVIGNEHVYVTAGSTVYALERSRGEVDWKFQAERDFTVLQYHDGIIYGGMKNRKLIALSAENGTVSWQKNIMITPMRVTLSDHYLAVVNNKLQYSVHSRESGELLWNHLSSKTSLNKDFTGSFEVCSPVLIDGKIIYQEIREINYREEKLFLNVASAKTGETQREIEIALGNRIVPGRTIMVRGDSCYLLVEQRSSKHLVAVDLDSGQIAWKRDYQGQLAWPSGAIMDSDRILIVGHHPKRDSISLGLVDSASGRLVQRLNLPSNRGGKRSLALRPVVSNGIIYIQNKNGTVYSLR